MSIRGALVKKSADQTSANYLSGTGVQTDGAIIGWDAEVYDTNGFHDNSQDNSRITIPAAVNGRRGILTACLSLSQMAAGNNVMVSILKNGAYQYIGFGGTTRTCGNISSGANANWVYCRTGPVLLTTGDYFEVRLYSGDNSITVESESSFGLLVLDSNTQTQRVLTRKASNQTTANYSTRTAIAWDTDIYDTDTIHDTSSNNTKLIIPSALNNKFVVACASVAANNITGGSECALGIAKGGSVTYDGFAGNSVGSALTTHGLVVRTQPIQVVTGNELEAVFYCSDTSITLLAEFSSFGLRVVG